MMLTVTVVYFLEMKRSGFLDRISSLHQNQKLYLPVNLDYCSGTFCDCLLVCCPKNPEKVCVTLLRPSGISSREVPHTDNTRNSVAESGLQRLQLV